MHDVISRYLRKLGRGPAGQSAWPILLPIPALVVEIGAQEVMHALFAIHDIGIGRTRGVVAVIMLPGPRQRGQFGEHRVWPWFNWMTVGIKRDIGRTTERSTHPRHAA